MSKLIDSRERVHRLGDSSDSFGSYRVLFINSNLKFKKYPLVIWIATAIGADMHRMLLTFRIELAVIYLVSLFSGSSAFADSYTKTVPLELVCEGCRLLHSGEILGRIDFELHSIRLCMMDCLSINNLE
jgi:hypothetical protein